MKRIAVILIILFAVWTDDILVGQTYSRGNLIRINIKFDYVHQITAKFTGHDERKSGIVMDHSLSAFPNPFNSSAII